MLHFWLPAYVICTFILVLAVLLALLPAAGAEREFRFTRENFPKLDGSTSMVPLGNGIASVLLGESREDTASLIAFNRTTQSFRNLCSGDSDIVIAAEPKNDVFQEGKPNGNGAADPVQSRTVQFFRN